MAEKKENQQNTLFTNNGLNPGLIVTITGLNNRKDLNNKTGLLIDFVTKSQRWQVLETCSGESFLLKPKNIIQNDALFQKILKFSEEDLCQKFIESLQNELCIKQNMTHTQIRSNFFANITKQEQNKKLCSQKLIFLDLCAYGHHLLINIYHTENMFRYRVFQCWVRNAVDNGYTIAQYLKSKQFRWYKKTELNKFCKNVLQLRATMTQLVDTELLDCCPLADLKSKRLWAYGIKQNLEKSGLTLQPGSLDMVEGYTKNMVNSGYPARAVVYLGSMDKPNDVKQIFDFPVKECEKVMKLTKNMFDANVYADAFLSAVEWHGDDKAWNYSIIIDISKLKL